MGPDLTIQEGANLFATGFGHILVISSGIKSKSECRIMRPHVDKNAKLFKIGRVIAIFVRISKIQKRVNKNEKQMRCSAIFE